MVGRALTSAIPVFTCDGTSDSDCGTYLRTFGESLQSAWNPRLPLAQPALIKLEDLTKGWYVHTFPDPNTFTPWSQPVQSSNSVTNCNACSPLTKNGYGARPRMHFRKFQAIMMLSGPGKQLLQRQHSPSTGRQSLSSPFSVDERDLWFEPQLAHLLTFLKDQPGHQPTGGQRQPARAAAISTDAETACPPPGPSNACPPCPNPG